MNDERINRFITVRQEKRNEFANLFMFTVASVISCYGIRQMYAINPFFGSAFADGLSIGLFGLILLIYVRDTVKYDRKKVFGNEEKQ
jgi:hypothetical protein